MRWSCCVGACSLVSKLSNVTYIFFQKPFNIAFREGNVDDIVRPRGVNPPLWLADCCKGDGIYIVIILEWCYNAIYVVFRSIYLPMHMINTYVIDDVCMYNTILDHIFSWNMCILYDGLIRHLNSERYYISATLLEWHGVSNRRQLVVCKTAYSTEQQRNQTNGTGTLWEESTANHWIPDKQDGNVASVSMTGVLMCLPVPSSL